MSNAARRALSALGISLLVIAVIIARHALASIVVGRTLAFVTGYEVSFTEMRLGSTRGALFNVRIGRAGEPVLEARRIDLTYALRDIFPGGQHRFGFVSLALDRPTIYLVRRRDGSYNLSRYFGSSASVPRSTRAASAALLFDARIRNGTIVLHDDAALTPDLFDQRFEDVSADATVQSNSRTRARVDAVYIARVRAGAPLQRYPIMLRTTIDYTKGYATHRLRAASVPLRGLLSFAIHSDAVRFEGGMAGDLDVRLYALGIALDRDIDYHLGGSTRVRDGELAIHALAQPIRRLNGTLTLTDAALTTRDLRADLGGSPIAARGGISDFDKPVIRLAIRGAGDLRDVRSILRFARNQPVRGRARIQALIENALDDPLIVIDLDAPAVAYGDFPIRGLHGLAAIYDDYALLGNVRGTYAGVETTVNGRFVLEQKTGTLLAVHAKVAANDLPYTENLLPGARVDVVGLLTGVDAAFGTRGVLSATGGGNAASGFFALDPQGRGEIGPFDFARGGGRLHAAYRIERDSSSSGLWALADAYPVLAKRATVLPGVKLPEFPPIAGIIGGRVVGAGTPDLFGVAGTFAARDLRVAGKRVGTGHANLTGTLDALALTDVDLNGSIGRFRGDVSIGAHAVDLRGRYTGNLAQLTPFTGELGAHGAVDGPLRVQIAKTTVVQTDGARLRGVSVRGVPVDSAAGTIAIDDAGHTTLYAARATIGMHDAVAVQHGSDFALSATRISADLLRVAGGPLTGGAVSLFGLGQFAREGPRFAGDVLVSRGRIGTYTLDGDANIDFAARRIAIHSGIGAFGGTYGFFGGNVSHLGADPRYAIDARIPEGDVRTLRRALGFAAVPLEGRFDAAVHITGSGNHPAVSGRVVVSEGRYNGLNFHHGRATFAIAAGGASARLGHLDVGTTGLDFAGSIRAGDSRLQIASPQVELADFNDLFNEGDTLAGRGPLGIAFSTDAAHQIVTNGTLALRDFRYRRLSFGNASGDWHMEGSRIRGAIEVDGPAGAFSGHGTIAPVLRDPLAAFAHARYDADATLSRVSLKTWLPALGIGLPILGQVDATAHVVGIAPALAITSDARLTQGSYGQMPIDRFTVRADSIGTRTQITAANLDLPFISLRAAGSFALTANAPLELAIHATASDIGKIVHRFVPGAGGIDVGGTLESEVRVRGSLAHPAVEAGFDIERGRYGSLVVPRTVGALAFEERTLTVRDIEFTLGKGTAFLAGSLPVSPTTMRLGPKSVPLDFDVTAKAVDLAQFSTLLPGGTHIGGALDGRFGVSGTVGAPRLIGSLQLARGSIQSPLQSEAIDHISGTVAFAGSSVALQTLHADAGNGALDATGLLQLPLAEGTQSTYVLDVRASHAGLNFPAYGRGTIDGTIELESTAAQPRLSGSIALSDATIPFAALYHPGNVAVAPEKPPFDLGFALRVKADHNVRVRSPLIDIGARGALTLGGTLARPLLAGEIVSTGGGTFSSYNRVFRVTDATVAFDPTAGIVPTIDLRASTHVANPDPNRLRNDAGTADITIQLDGPADNVRTSYESVPAYSQEKILGLLFDAQVLGAGVVDFNRRGTNVPVLRGTPGESNVLLPPNLSGGLAAGQTSLNSEVLSILNGQISQRLISPIANLFGGALGVNDLGVTIDRAGNVGFNARKALRKKIYAVYGETLAYPYRQTFGFEARPNGTTAIQLTVFTQAGNTSAFGAGATSSINASSRINAGQPLGGRDGFSLNFQKFFK